MGMNASQLRPDAGAFRVGSDFRLRFLVRDQDGDPRDYTGATMASGCASFTDDAGTELWTATAALTATPSQEPQVQVDVADTDTAAIVTPQVVDCTVTITLADASVDRIGCRFVLVH